MHPTEKSIELKLFSETRWSAQIAACHAVKMRLDVILLLLEQLGDDSNRDRAVEARSILSMIDLKFVFCLHMFNDLLRHMKAASDSLQSVQLNASVACDLIKNCKEFLEEKQSDEACSIYIEDSKNVASTFELSTDIVKRKTRVPSRLEGDMLVH